MERETIVEEQEVAGVANARGLMAFPSNVWEGTLFLAVNEQDDSEDDGFRNSAIYLTAEQCEKVGLQLIRQSIYLREVVSD